MQSHLGFINSIMKNGYQVEESVTMTKYFDHNFEVIFLNDRNVKHHKCVVVDKRKTQHVVYTDIKVAKDKIAM